MNNRDLKIGALIIFLIVVSFILSSCAPSNASAAMVSEPRTKSYTWTMVANHESDIVQLDHYNLATISAPAGTAIQIVDTQGVTVSPSGWAVSKNGTEIGQFGVIVTNCPVDCPVAITITVSK